MPLPVIEVPLFPAVPLADGVPAVLRAAGPVAQDVIAYLTADGILPSAKVAKALWAIYTTGGGEAIAPDSMLSFEYSKDHTISNYPAEKGAFQSYNKVEMPRILHITLSKGGKVADRNSFQMTLSTMSTSLNTYSVLTPETSYFDMSLVSVNYRRSAREGANMLIADLRFEEVRTSAAAAFSNTAEPSGAAVVNGGPVQPRALTDGEKKAMAGGHSS